MERLECIKFGKAKWSRYRPGVAQRVGTGLALLFHNRGTRRGVSGQQHARPHVTRGKDPVPIWQEARWPPGPEWTGGKSLPHRDSIPDRPASSSVAVPTELPGPRIKLGNQLILCRILSTIQLRHCNWFAEIKYRAQEGISISWRG